MSKKKVGLTMQEVDRFLKLQAQMQELLARMTAISGKAPDQAINKFKLSVINEQLKIANDILVDQARPFASFETFDETALPSNSDVVVVLSQYLACLETWRSAHVVYKDYKWHWSVVDGAGMRTDQPSNRGLD